MRVRFWGTRGSIATPGPSTNRFGGNTSCIEIVTDSGSRLILDCGTGARLLGHDLMTRFPEPTQASILLTHTHWDHIQGFPFFAPLFRPGNQITVHAPSGGGRSLADTLAGQMEFGYFPVELSQLPARMTYEDINEGAYEIGGARVIAQYLNHPAMTLAYRIEADGASVVYACDHEMYAPSLWISGGQPGIDSIVHANDRRHAQFLKGADLVIHDAQYTPAEYSTKRNWGHSTYEYAVGVSFAAGAKRLALTHHDPSHDDATIVQLERDARRLAATYAPTLRVFAAYEGCEVSLRAHEERDEKSVSIPAASVKVTSGSSAHQRVLIIDDDPALRALAKVALNGAGYRVLEAGGGSEGIRMAQELLPDLILVDLLMPAPGGLDVLRALRDHQGTAEIPVIILTVHTDECNTLAGFDAGASDYLAKPFTIPQLTARVRSCLARAGAVTKQS